MALMPRCSLTVKLSYPGYILLGTVGILPVMARVR